MGPEAFDYALPAEQIAAEPPANRGDARMLVIEGPRRHHAHARDLDLHLPDNALVVLNDSRVVPARLIGTRPDGRTFELLVCRPGPAVGAGHRISAWVRGAKRLRVGDRLAVGDLELEYQDSDDTDPRARWFAVVAGDLLEACHRHGQVPLPPYIARDTGPTAQDRERYQTIFAREEGSVAAPTAGLHFSPELLAKLDSVKITLHVGPGTFLPMDVPDVARHRVGAERFSISVEAAQRIQEARACGRPIVAVGTTVTRTLETVALQHEGDIVAAEGTTELVITPQHHFAVVDHLLTNFHLPRSSLLMLVCSFAGREPVLEAYAQAVSMGYRFYSYGDCMLAARRPQR